MVHAFTLLSLVDHYCLSKLNQNLNPWLHPIRWSKLLWSLIPTEKKSAERSIIERLEKVKAIVISYELLMSCKMEEIFLLMAHYCTGPERKKLILGCRTPLLLMVFPCIRLLWRGWINSDWRQILWRLLVMMVALLRFVGRQWSQNTPMNPLFTTEAPIHHGVSCTHIGRVL